MPTIDDLLAAINLLQEAKDAADAKDAVLGTASSNLVNAQEALTAATADSTAAQQHEGEQVRAVLNLVEEVYGPPR